MIVDVIPDVDSLQCAVFGDGLCLVDHELWMGVKPLLNGQTEQQFDSVWSGLGLNDFYVDPAGFISITTVVALLSSGEGMVLSLLILGGCQDCIWEVGRVLQSTFRASSSSSYRNAVVHSADDPRRIFQQGPLNADITERSGSSMGGRRGYYFGSSHRPTLDYSTTAGDRVCRASSWCSILPWTATR